MKDFAEQIDPAWGLERQELHEKQSIERAKKILKYNISRSHNTAEIKAWEKELKEISSGHEEKFKSNGVINDLCLEPNCLIINEIIQKSNLNQLSSAVANLHQYSNSSSENPFDKLYESEVAHCISIISTWTGHSGASTNIQPIIFNKGFNNFYSLIICFNDFTQSMVSVEFILGLKDNVQSKIVKNTDGECISRNVFPDFFEKDNTTTVIPSIYREDIVQIGTFMQILPG